MDGWIGKEARARSRGRERGEEKGLDGSSTPKTSSPYPLLLLNMNRQCFGYTETRLGLAKVLDLKILGSKISIETRQYITTSKYRWGQRTDTSNSFDTQDQKEDQKVQRSTLK